MTIKKMAIAAVLTAGLFAGTMNLAIGSDCGCGELPSITGPACPLDDCKETITPDNAKCPKCHKMKDDCGCKKKKEKKQKKCTPCDEPQASCDPIPIASSGICPNTCPDATKNTYQAYAYPQAIYGNHNVRVGESSNGVTITDASSNPVTASSVCPGGCNLSSISSSSLSGIPVLSSDNDITGAAASLPCLNQSFDSINGVPVERNCQTLDGVCPIQIQTETSMDVNKKSMVPFDYSSQMGATGAAAPVVSAFEDVPDGFWASCDINKLTENNVIAGYPDRTFKPNLPVSRAEFASMAVKGFNLDTTLNAPQAMFKDVPRSHWANKYINKSVSEGLMTGYPNDKFMPNSPVSRTEALTILSKGVKCSMDECKAKDILSKYCDGTDVPSWATIPVAKSLDVGAIADTPSPNQIMPNRDATRAELASMLEQVRIAGGYSNKDIASATDCGCTGGAAYMEKQEIVTLPTLQLCFNDELSARAANVGEQFAATTIDSVVIDGTTYPSGSIVRGKVLEVQRPTKNCEGALKLSFNTIEHCDNKADLPQQVLNAQVNKTHRPNFIARTIEWPFTMLGQIVGTAGRTVGGAAVSLSNAFEQVTGSFGIATGELTQGQFKAAGRSYQDSAKALVKAPVDLTRTALSGTLGTLQVGADEISYLVDPKGMKISSINPKEKVTIAFGCNSR